MIRITSKKDGFRRCGVAHSTTPTEYADGFFTAEQLAILRAEPMLVVELCPDLCPEPPAPGPEQLSVPPAPGPEQFSVPLAGESSPVDAQVTDVSASPVADKPKRK